MYLYKVLDCKVAEKKCEDGHLVEQGQKYLTAHYLEKMDKRSRGDIQYKLIDKTVECVLPQSIFYPCVPMSDNYTLSASEYVRYCLRVICTLFTGV